MRLAAEAIALWTRVPRRWVLETLNIGARGALFAFEMAAISTVIQIGLALPMAEYFHRVSFTGLTANLLIVPLLNAVVPIGFVAIFTGWRWVGHLAGTLLRASAAVADWHARLEPSWRVADPPWWIAVGFVASLIVMAAVVGRRFWRWPALGAVLAFFALLLWHPARPDLRPGTLELTAIDVGQGDSLLVVFPDSKIMIVDGGGMLAYGRVRKPNIDMGEDVVSPYLWSRGIRRVDVIAVTHAHEDHSGGIAALIENFRPREVWVGASPLKRVLEAAARRKIPVIARLAGEQIDYGGAKIEVISPPKGYVGRHPGNNDSLAVRIAYGRRSFLLTGDMEKPMEARALAGGFEMQADVLKVGHHGSKTSTIQPFLDAVSPSIAIISDGYQNSFGHPHPDVLARLMERHAAVLRTDLDGLITVRTDGNRIWMDSAVWEGLSAWWLGERGFNWAQASE
jgi:competence protein ComEC